MHHKKITHADLRKVALLQRQARRRRNLQAIHSIGRNLRGV